MKYFYVIFLIQIALLIAGNDEQTTTTTTNNLPNQQPPVLFIPGLLSSRLIAWKKKKCRGANIDVQDIIWLNLQTMVETRTYDPHCWIDAMKLTRNGSDPHDSRVRPDEGLAAIGELCPGSLFVPAGTSIFSSLIKYLANEHGYDANNLIGMPYDWRLSPSQLQQRDLFFTTMKFKLETAYKMHALPAIVVTHSMGVNLFLYFIEWLKLQDKRRWRKWLRKHVGAFVGFAAPLLGAPGTVKSVLSGHTFGLTITEAQAREMELSFSSTHFLNPRSSRQEYDYTDPIVYMRSASGGSNMTFGVRDIENGDLFKIVGNICKDEDLAEKYNSLQDLYTNDVINPLGIRFERPPIKHVAMVYGVDVKTEVAYSYRMPEPSITTATTTSNNGVNFIYNSPPNTSGKLSPILEEIIMEEPCTQYTTSGSRSTLVSGYLSEEITPLEEFCLVNGTLFMEGYFDDVCNNKEIMSTKILRRSAVQIQQAKHHHQRDLLAIDKSCKSEIVAMSVKKLSQKRRFIKKSDVHHSGDGSVPYVSLHYAHNWLEGADVRYEEHKPASEYRTWSAPLKMVNINSPATDIYYGNKLNGETTVIAEISGIDHIEITSNRYVHTEFITPLVERVYREAVLDAREKAEEQELAAKLRNWWESFADNVNIHLG